MTKKYIQSSTSDTNKETDNDGYKRHFCATQARLAIIKITENVNKVKIPQRTITG
jgi:hypothetical protein